MRSLAAGRGAGGGGAGSEDGSAAVSKASKRVLMREIALVLRREWGRLIASLFLLLIGAGCRLAQPWIVMLAIDRYLRAEDAGVGGALAGPLPMDGFWWLVWSFLGLAAFEAIARWAQQVLVESAGQRALLELRTRVFGHLQRLPAAFLDRTPVGKLVGRVTTDIEALQELFASGVVTILGDLVFLIASVWLMASLSVPLTSVTMLVVPVLVLITMWVRVHARKAYAAMRSKLSRMHGDLHEQVSGMSVVQMFGQEQRAADRFGEANKGVRDAQIQSVHWESILSAATELLGSLTIALILWYGGGLAVGAEAGLTLGALFAFVDYMQRFFGPLNDLSMKYTVMQNGFVAGDRIFALLDEAIEQPCRLPESAAGSAGDESHADWAVEFDGVHFGYVPERAALNGLTFRVKPGQKVAVVGATGSGKSTLLNLLTRLYELDGEGGPSTGAIRLFGRDLRSIPLEELRSRIGVVPQDAFLFHGTILDNVRVGHPEISREAAIEAADRLGLGEVVKRFPRGYDEPIAERGKNLSAGERQLIAFARMLIRAPDVLLLDEATSSVDSATESLLQGAVDCLMQGRTSIVVAHRLATIQDADRIFVLHAGELVEEGTHEQLLRRTGEGAGGGGVYARLHRLQFAAESGAVEGRS